MEERQAHATSLAVIFPISAISAVLYYTGDFIPLTETLFLCGGAAAGGLVGALLLGRINVKLLNRVFTALMLASGIRMLF